MEEELKLNGMIIDELQDKLIVDQSLSNTSILEGAPNNGTMEPEAKLSLLLS